MSKPTSPGMKAAYELLKMRNEWGGIPKKDDDLEFLVNRILIALNLVLESEREYTDKGLKDIKQDVIDYAKQIRDENKIK